MFKVQLTTLERFMQYVSPEPNSGCWLWTAHINKLGYGTFALGPRAGMPLWKGAKMRAAHRVSYELHVGTIPEGMDLDHLCRVRCCVNPQHLEAVTHAENCRRGIAGKVSAARERAKTHCPRGHEYSTDNTFVTQGGRKCKACRKLFDQRRYALFGRRDRKPKTSSLPQFESEISL